jgi:hypothetical protein
MKSPRAFLFFSVETQTRRRALVMAYYGFFAAISVAMILWRGPSSLNKLLQFAVICALFLGGMTAAGPVRLFSPWQRKFADGSAIGVDANRPHPYLPGIPLIDAKRLRVDEHDLHARDRAHYLAYAALRWAVVLFALFAPLGFYVAGPNAFARLLLLLCFPFCVLFLSLPQAIILWTEPDLEPDPSNSGTKHLAPQVSGQVILMRVPVLRRPSACRASTREDLESDQSRPSSRSNRAINIAESNGWG